MPIFDFKLTHPIKKSEGKIQMTKTSYLVMFLLLSIVVTVCSVKNPVETKHQFPLAQDFNIDEPQLIQAFDAMQQVDGALSLIVCRHGTIVAEEFYNYNQYGADSIKDVMSVTKSFTGVLVGLAIDQGYITSVNDPIRKYLEGLVSFPDSVHANITIDQLLKMSAGHLWNGTSPSSQFSNWMSAPNQLQFIIDLPIVFAPGTEFNYSDGASHLLSVIVSEATGLNTLDFAKKYLFAPLGIVKYAWRKDSFGYSYGAYGLRMLPRDMVKFGNLILNKGKSNGVQIVSEAWIDRMTATKISTNNNVSYGPEYGYQIWIGNAGAHKHLMAMGWGGQFILIVPEQNLVVTATCWHSGLSWQQAGAHWTSIINIIVNHIFPAAK